MRSGGRLKVLFLERTVLRRYRKYILFDGFTSSMLIAPSMFAQASRKRLSIDHVVDSIAAGILRTLRAIES
jgi:hypothetical protein